MNICISCTSLISWLFILLHYACAINTIQELTPDELTPMQFIQRSSNPFLSRSSIKNLEKIKPWTFEGQLRTMEKGQVGLYTPTSVRCGGQVNWAHEKGSQTTLLGALMRLKKKRGGVCHKEGEDCYKEGGACYGVTPITREFSDALFLLRPPLQYCDFELMDLNRSGILHLASHSSIAVVPRNSFSTSAGFLCLLEGRATLTFIYETFNFNGELKKGDCALIPKQWSATVLSSTEVTALVTTWSDDLVLTEAIIDHLTSDESKGSFEVTAATLPFSVSSSHRGSYWLPAPVLDSIILSFIGWGSAATTMQQFMERASKERMLVPELVTCESGCRASLNHLFEVLDVNHDSHLDGDDLTALTVDALRVMSHEIDDIIEELREDAQEEWSHALKDPSSRTNFLQMAKERQLAAAHHLADRIRNGHLSSSEREILENNLPELVNHLPPGEPSAN